jgi:hypothetical protein
MTTATVPASAAKVGPAPPTVVPAATLQLVRPAVRDILTRSAAFRRLPPEEQRELAQQMVKVSAYMADPDGLASDELSKPPEQRLVRAQDDPADAVAERLAASPGSTGADFRAGAVEQGVEQFGALVKKVDFPKFVGGLIENVFQAIVQSSLDQMRAYGELLANVAKSVDEFARDNISPNNARDWLVGRFPDVLELNEAGLSQGFADGAQPAADGTTPTPAPQPTVQQREDAPTESVQAMLDALGGLKDVDLSDEKSESELVRRAQLEMARGRQQLLSSMVMLGINRIVVTDGLIHAKVVFDMRAQDVQKRTARASLHDVDSSSTQAGVRSSYGGWFSPVKASGYAETRQDHMTTVESSVDDSSESRAEVKAKLTGEVRVNFKSDYFPMEKLATPAMIAAIQGNAQPLEKPVEGT